MVSNIVMSACLSCTNLTLTVLSIRLSKQEELLSAYFVVIKNTAAARPMLLSSTFCHGLKYRPSLGPLSASSGS